jgi:FkbH-like protein
LDYDGLVSELRLQIEAAVEEKRYAEAVSLLAAFWRSEAASSTAGFVNRCYEKMRGAVALTPLRVSILRSFTVEPLQPILRAQAFVAGLDLDLHVGEFNAWAQEILDDASPLYAHKPDVVILAVQTRDIAPELWPGAGDFEPGSGAPIADRVAGELRNLVQVFRQRSQASLIVHNLEMPDLPGPGIFDAQSPSGQAAAIGQINAALRATASETRGVYVLDYDNLVARYGRRNWTDERRWLTVRLPVRADHLHALAEEWVRYCYPLAGRIAKVLAVDLDNTLWGGVIGEDGMDGIRLNGEYPGAGHQALQRALLDLHRRGILLAVVSKNNYEDAMEAIERHTGMLLRARHFSALRINWQDKAQNLKEIAAELNLGLDSIAFLDDNPVERQHVRDSAPEVMVIEPGDDPIGFARAVREFPAFERLALSEEDRKRGEYYAADRQRAELESSSSSREDFYRSLAQVAEMAPVSPATLARVAQLTQKTNQFNLTTRRYSEAQVTEMAGKPDWEVLSIRVWDRYCDNGIVGVAITNDHDGVCEIDTFLLSCRVIGRTVETALLARLCDQARARGCRRVEGWFLPTKKNAPAKDFYRSHGFSVSEEHNGGLRYSLDLSTQTVATPPWIELRAESAVPA